MSWHQDLRTDVFPDSGKYYGLASSDLQPAAVSLGPCEVLEHSTLAGTNAYLNRTPTIKLVDSNRGIQLETYNIYTGVPQTLEESPTTTQVQKKSLKPLGRQATNQLDSR